jgi:hypothetical protein
MDQAAIHSSTHYLQSKNDESRKLSRAMRGGNNPSITYGKTKFPYESNSISRIAGPARIFSSLALSPLFVTMAYTTPLSCSGMVTFPFWTGTKIVSRPVRKTTNSGPDNAWGLSKVSVETEPGVEEDKVRAAKAFTGSGGLVEGHDSMNPAANVKIWFKPRGTLMASADQ